MIDFPLVSFTIRRFPPNLLTHPNVSDLKWIEKLFHFYQKVANVMNKNIFDRCSTIETCEGISWISMKSLLISLMKVIIISRKNKLKSESSCRRILLAKRPSEHKVLKSGNQKSRSGRRVDVNIVHKKLTREFCSRLWRLKIAWGRKGIHVCSENDLILSVLAYLRMLRSESKRRRGVKSNL